MVNRSAEKVRLLFDSTSSSLPPYPPHPHHARDFAPKHLSSIKALPMHRTITYRNRVGPHKAYSPARYVDHMLVILVIWFGVKDS